MTLARLTAETRVFSKLRSMEQRPHGSSAGGPSEQSVPSTRVQSFLDEDPDFGSITSTSTSQASDHVVDMPDGPPEVTVVWKDLEVVRDKSN